jgi:hypothetical protein
MEAERAGFALVDDLSLAVDQVQTIRPAGVSLFGHVVEAVDDGGELNAQFPNAAVCHIDALVEALWAGEDDLIFHIALHLPDVAGMSFQDVNGVERYVVAVFLVQLVEGGNLPPKGRSSVAAEDEHDRLLSSQ